MKKITAICLILILTSCANANSEYKERLPQFNFSKFFQGDLCAKGLVRSRNGLVNRKFVADIKATSDDDMVILDELFLFDDGEKQTRLWRFNKKNAQWYGTAGDVIDQAIGKTIGDSLNLVYQLKINIDGQEYTISMDDWLHQIDDNTLMGSTDMSKWGFNVGRIDIVIEKRQQMNAKQHISKQSMIQSDESNVQSHVASSLENDRDSIVDSKVENCINTN